MPSQFLKDRLPKFAAEVAGTETVQYFALATGAKDSFTGTVEPDATAYPDIGITLTAGVDFSPTENMRKMIGATIDFDALLWIAVVHLTENEITLKIGDAFVLPNESDKSYVKKIVETHQTDTGHIVKLVAVSRRRGRR